MPGRLLWKTTKDTVMTQANSFARPAELDTCGVGR